MFRFASKQQLFFRVAFEHVGDFEHRLERQLRPPMDDKSRATEAPIIGRQIEHDPPGAGLKRAEVCGVAL
jgi:hypothetical protein